MMARTLQPPWIYSNFVLVIETWRPYKSNLNQTNLNCFSLVIYFVILSFPQYCFASHCLKISMDNRWKLASKTSVSFFNQAWSKVPEACLQPFLHLLTPWQCVSKPLWRTLTALQLTVPGIKYLPMKNTKTMLLLRSVLVRMLNIFILRRWMKKNLLM